MELSQMKEVTIYIDGVTNPMHEGVGGYGIVLIHEARVKELSGGFQATTHNRMDIYAAIKGLEELKMPCVVTLFSDSQNLVSTMMEGWVIKWKNNDWIREKGEKAANRDLWEKLLSLCEFHQVEFKWMKSDNDDAYFRKCHHLARKALTQNNLPADDGYTLSLNKDQPTISDKITYEGQPCRKCSTPVIKRIPRKKPKSGQAYYYEYYLFCPGCSTMYMVDEAKRAIE
jgi:ribonuclease HI